MNVNIENEYPNDLSGFMSEDEYKEIALKAVKETLSEEGCPFEAELSILLTDDENIRNINLEQRKIDKSTDVLSFPMIDFKSPSCFEGFEGDFSLFDPDTKELFLGDIVISIDHCLLQAQEYGHNVRREYAFLITHSMLHLLGYDHENQAQSLVMEEKQKKILNSIGLGR